MKRRLPSFAPPPFLGVGCGGVGGGERRCTPTPLERRNHHNRWGESKKGRSRFKGVRTSATLKKGFSRFANTLRH